MIEVENLGKDFRKVIKEPGLSGAVKFLFKPQYTTFEAVKDLTFQVPKGQILGFIGANGAGKSTTIKMLTGILTPTRGRCMINGKVPQENRQAFVKEIGVVFGQRTQLWWDLPLTETYSVLKEIYDVPTKEFEKRMAFLNEVLELSDFIKDPVRTLSLGQRMRADIAASMLHNPKVLFLDEPTIGLDVSVKDNIRKAIRQINQEEETTIILTTHDLSDIENLCSRLLLIDKGRAIFDGSIEQMKATFGRMHSLEFALLSQQEEKVLRLKATDDLQIERDKSRLCIHFDSQKYLSTDLIKLVLEDLMVQDVKIKEADIEDIIRRFYRKELD